MLWRLRRSYSTAERLRSALREYPQPVVLLTARTDVLRGIIVSSFTSLSLDPPTVTFNVKTPSRALSAMKARFDAHILTYSKQNIDLARRYSTNEGNEDVNDLVVDDVTKLYCETRRMIDVGDHCIVIGEVIKVEKGGKALGMVYRNGQFLPVE